jgi:hypothetical protein
MSMVLPKPSPRLVSGTTERENGDLWAFALTFELAGGS